MSLPDFMSVLEELVLPAPDFMSVDDEGDGELPLSAPPLVLGLLVLAPAPDDDPPVAPLLELLPAPWANADVASIAPATVSASALIHVFITILLML